MKLDLGLNAIFRYVASAVVGAGVAFLAHSPVTTFNNKVLYIGEDAAFGSASLFCAYVAIGTAMIYNRLIKWTEGSSPEPPSP